MTTQYQTVSNKKNLKTPDDIAKTISKDIIKNLTQCIQYNCNNPRKYNSKIQINVHESSTILASFKYQIVTNSANGFLNLKIKNPVPRLLSTFVRFFDLRVDDSLKGQGIFKKTMQNIEKFCDDHLVVIMVTEFANQKLR